MALKGLKDCPYYKCLFGPKGLSSSLFNPSPHPQTANAISPSTSLQWPYNESQAARWRRSREAHFKAGHFIFGEALGLKWSMRRGEKRKRSFFLNGEKKNQYSYQASSFQPFVMPHTRQHVNSAPVICCERTLKKKIKNCDSQLKITLLKSKNQYLNCCTSQATIFRWESTGRMSIKHSSL